jgi:hypothetical protein
MWKNDSELQVRGRAALSMDAHTFSGVPEHRVKRRMADALNCRNTLSDGTLALGSGKVTDGLQKGMIRRSPCGISDVFSDEILSPGQEF